MSDRVLRVVIEGSAEGVKKAFRETEQSSTSLGSKFGALGKTALALGGAAGLAIVTEGLKQCFDAAEKEQVSTANLDKAFKSVGLSAKDYSTNIEDLNAKGRTLGYTNVETQDSFGKLLLATKNVAEATREEGIAVDLARARHISLAAAADQLTKAHTGSARVLKQFGETIAPVTTAEDKLKAAHVDTTTKAGALELAHAKLVDKMATGNAIIDAVAQKVKGQGQAYADTSSGGMAQFSAQLDNVEAKIGQKLLPIFDQALKWVNQHWPEISAAIDTACKVIGQAIDVVKPIVEAFFKALVAQAKIVMDLIHGNWSAAWKDFKTIVETPVNAVKGALDALWKDVEGPVSAAWGFLSRAVSKAFGDIKTTFTSIWDPIYSGFKTALNWIRDHAHEAWDALLTAVNRVWKLLSPVLDAMKAAIGAVVWALQKLKDLYDAVSGLLSSGPSNPNPNPVGPGGPTGPLPPKAAGGAVMAGASYLVGELGPELFVPASSGTIVPNSSLGGDVHVHIHDAVLSDNKRAFADAVAQEVYSSMQRLKLVGLT